MPLPRILAQVCALTLIVLLSACGVSDPAADSGSGGDDTGSDDSSSAETQQIGVAQKGPFEAGGNATAFKLNDDGTVSDTSVAGQIVANGAYELPELSWTGPTQIKLSGTYFDETTGEFSAESIELRAIVEAGEGLPKANVNLYSHLTAARTAHLLGEGQDFSAAQSAARSEFSNLVGTSNPPVDLDFLNPQEDAQEDSSSLLLFSAAALSAGHGQAEIDAIAADFADDGMINGSASTSGEGQTAWQEIQTEAADPGLLQSARDNLSAQYTDSEPPSNDGGFAWLLDPCTVAMLDSPRAVCEGEPFYGNSLNDSGEFVVFVPLVTGHYTVELFGDPNAEDDNTGRCSWTIYTEADVSSSSRGDSRNTDGFCGVEDVSTSRLTGGERYYVLADVAKDDDAGPAARFRLSVTRVTEGSGSESGAVEIDNDLHEGVVGVLIGSSTTSYYKFTAGTGVHTITLGGYPCGDGELRLKLYEDSSFNTDVDDPHEYDACSQKIETSLETGKTYYLEVENWLGQSWNRKSFRPAPGAIDYELRVTTD